MEESDIRPVTVLNRYLAHSGFDRHIHPTGPYQLVAMYDSWNELADDFRTAFVVLSIGDDMDKVLEHGYMESVELIRNDYDNGLTENCRKLGALIMVMYGEAQLARNEAVPVSSETPPEFVQAASWGMTRSRLVHVVTPDGFATQSIIFPPESEADTVGPLVDVSEHWSEAPTEDEANTGRIGAIPRVTELMCMVLGIGLLLGMSTERGEEPTVLNMARIASEFATGETGDRANIADDVLGLMVKFGEYVEGEKRRFTDLSRELRRMQGEDD